MSQAPATTTIGRVTNTTSSTLILLYSSDCLGQFVQKNTYPSEIPPGGTITFYHIRDVVMCLGGVIVYRFIVSSDKAYDIGIGWFNQPGAGNQAFTSVAEAGSFTPERMNQLRQHRPRDNDSDSASDISTLDGCTSAVEIGNGNFPTLEATISYSP